MPTFEVQFCNKTELMGEVIRQTADMHKQKNMETIKKKIIESVTVIKAYAL